MTSFCDSAEYKSLTELFTGSESTCKLFTLPISSQLLLSARTAMWSMPVVLTKMENENDSANQNYVAKMTLQNDVEGPNNVVCRWHNFGLLI